MWSFMFRTKTLDDLRTRCASIQTATWKVQALRDRPQVEERTIPVTFRVQHELWKTAHHGYNVRC